MSDYQRDEDRYVEYLEQEREEAREKSRKRAEADRRIDEAAEAAGMTRGEYLLEQFKRYFAIFAFLFGPLIIDAFAKHILLSVHPVILVPVLVISTIGIAGSTAWFAGKKLGERLNSPPWGLLLIRIFIFLFISLFIYTLFYQNASFLNVIQPIQIVFVIIIILRVPYTLLSNTMKGISTYIFTDHRDESVTLQNVFKSISFFFYVGIIMALAVQLASANRWTFLFFKSYEDAFATSIGLIAVGAAHTSFTWRNGYLGFGIISTTIGGFAWKYKWIMPIIGTYEVPLYIGISLILYAVFPKVIGIIFLIAGIILLGIQLFLAFSQGLSAVNYNIAVFAIILLGLSYLMMRRHKKISESGLFKLRK